MKFAQFLFFANGFILKKIKTGKHSTTIVCLRKKKTTIVATLLY